MHKWQLARIAADHKSWAEKGGKVARLSLPDQEDAVRRITTAIQPVLAKTPAMKEFYETLRSAAATVQ
jgi:hypothetical protein